MRQLPKLKKKRMLGKPKRRLTNKRLWSRGNKFMMRLNNEK
jgi:hypothetical protein